MAQLTKKHLATILLLLQLFPTCLGLIQAHIDLIEYITHKLKACTSVLYQLDKADINALSRKARYPLIVVTKEPKSLFSNIYAERPKCVTTFVKFGSLHMEQLRNMLQNIRYVTTIVFCEKEEQQAFNSNLKDHLILVHEQESDLKLSTTCSSYMKPAQSMVWLRNSKQILVSGIDFLTIQNSCATTLRNKNVIVSAKETPPFVIALPHGRHSGSEIDLMNLLSDKIGFNYVLQENDWHGNLNPATSKLDRIIASVHNNTSQFGIGDIPIKLFGNASKLPTDFTPEIRSDAYIFLVPKPKPLYPFLNFLKPFSYWVWLSLILSTVTCIATVHTLMCVAGNKASSFWQVSLEIIGTSVGQNIKYTLTRPNSSVLAIVVTSWIIAMFFKDAAYYCNLRSFIVKKDFEKEIETEEDLVNMRIDCYIPANSVLDDDYKYSKVHVKQEIYARAVERKTLFTFNSGMSLEDERRTVQDGGVRIVVKLKAGSLLMEMETHLGYQPYKAAKKELWKKDAVGFLLPAFQPWSEEVNWILVRLVDAGIVEHLVRKYTPINKYSYQDCAQDHREQLESYRIDHIAGSLMLLFVGLFLATIVACIEQQWEKWTPLLKIDLVHFH